MDDLEIEDRYPAIPTVDEFNQWREKLSGKSFGTITISIRSSSSEISDDGTGIPRNYIDLRIRKFRDPDDQIDLSYNEVFNRR